MIPWLDAKTPFPPVAMALTEPNGLLAAGVDLSPDRLLEAYSQGIFPWFGPGEPVLWWTPDPRMVLVPEEFKRSRSLAKRLKRGDYEIRVDTAFEAVIRACAEPRPKQQGTWIVEPIVRAYVGLHERGHAHSFETWQDGRLVGGLYGVAIGRMFYGESMFTRITDGSKLAFAHLVAQLRRWQFGLIDCQMETSHLASLGARPIPRDEFMARLDKLIHLPDVPGPWCLDHDLVA